MLYYSGEKLTLGKLYVPFSVVRHAHGAGIDVGDAMHFVLARAAWRNNHNAEPSAAPDRPGG